MIDYLMSFTNEQAAQDDPVMAPYFYEPATAWTGHNVIPNAQSWNPANDTVEEVPAPGGGTREVIVHSYASGWWCLIGVTKGDPDLEADNNMVVALDRDAASGGAPASQYVKAYNKSLFPDLESLLAGCRFQPVFMGSRYKEFGIE